ncbi:MAG: capsule assembly Wzi family protein [Candidatus Symbiothrix sp.]|jgi:hypothetical protein|nr:capsule assembly Wzi family protein [Candidatus Symbiothrix sp.]
MKRPLLLSIICLFFLDSFSQINTTYQAEIFGSLATGEHTPFWMVNRTWGMVPLDANNFYLRGAVFHDQQLNKDWSFGLGVDMAGSAPHTYKQVWIQQAYGELNWKNFRLRIGSKEEYISLLDEQLSSGDFSASNHARPIPEIRINMDNFWLIPYTKGNLYLKGDFAIGKYLDGQWQENTAKPEHQSYTKDVLSHHKSIYFRLKDIEKESKWQVTVGLAHYVQWGGLLYKYRDIDNEYQYIVEDQPQGITDFIRAMVAGKGGIGSSGADSINAAGSHSGNYILKLDYVLKNDACLSFYFQHFFEDGSSMNPRSFQDMLLGLQYKSNQKRLLSGAVLEYIYTKNQAGPIHFVLADDEHASVRTQETGNDDYYNNVDYVQGPSHFGKTTGSPLLLSPEYNTGGSLNFKSNRIIAFHLGLEGYLRPALQYRLSLTTGQSWGRYYIPFTAVKKGFASQLELIYTCPQTEGLAVKLSAGYDKGTFFGGDTFGGGLTLTKRGLIYTK